MAAHLVTQLRQCSNVKRVVITLNVPEPHAFAEDGFLKLIVNSNPKGYGANHNTAFNYCEEEYFCVLNPDIRLNGDPFPVLTKCLERERASIGAPLIFSPAGRVEDSARYFPKVGSLLRKALGRSDGRYSVPPDGSSFSPDWVAGMFMLFRSSDFACLGGFDERYYMYYEDVDICRRARAAGMGIVVCPDAIAIHDARRASRRNFWHMRWHLASMVRYLWTDRKY